MIGRLTPPDLDAEDRQAERALGEFKRRCGDGYRCGRIVEALAGIARGEDVLAGYRDAAEGDAAPLGIPEGRASRIASETLEGHHRHAQEIAEKLRRELRFCAHGCEDAGARKIDDRLGLGLAPQVSTETLRLHFSEAAAAERLDRWRRLLEALKP
ncbi:MAG: hypothetical protein M0002_18820 [Rhodospirillales bacterium]|nr:hypothetical protein [Rhodospirillales bacterium]